VILISALAGSGFGQEETSAAAVVQPIKWTEISRENSFRTGFLRKSFFRQRALFARRRDSDRAES
jgi:hypothetical protein